MKETFFHMRDTIRIIPANACISVFLIFIPRNRRLWNLSYHNAKVFATEVVSRIICVLAKSHRVGINAHMTSENGK